VKKTEANKREGKSPAAKTQKAQHEKLSPDIHEWQTLYENAPLGICLLSSTGQILKANQALLKMLHYKLKELSALSLKDISFAADANEVQQFFKELVNEKLSCLEWEKRYRRKNGQEIWGASYASWMEEESSKSGFVLLMITDTTERRLVEDALRKNAAFRKAVIDSAGEGVCVCHPIASYPFVEFTVFNKRMEELTGYTMEEVNRKGWYQSIYPDPEVQKRAIDRMARMRVGDNLLDEEWLITRKNGEKRLISISTSMVMLGEGQVHILGLMHDLTKKKMAEAAVVEANQQLLAFFQEARDAMFIADPYSGIIKYANKQAEKLIKRPKSELIGIHQALLHPPEDGEKYRAQFRDQVLSMGKDRVEGEVISSTGERIPVEISCSIIELEGGKKFIQGIFHDITERKRVEEALHESQQMLRSILDTIPVRVFWKNLDSVYLGCNRVFAADAGFADPEAVIGMDDLRLGWAEQAELYRADDKQVMETGKPKLHYEEPQTTPQGDLIWLRTSKIPLRNLQNEIVGVMGTYEDITDWKNAETNLRENEERLARIVETCPVGIIILDKAGKVTLVNSTTEKILGLTRENLIGHPYDSLHWTITEINGKPFLPEKLPYSLVMQTRKPVFGTELALKNAKGQDLSLSMNASPLRDKEGDIQGMVLALSDITERLKAEEDRRDLERQMLHAQKLESLGVMAGGIAHDFNNFLMAIMGNAELASASLDPESSAYAGLREIEKTSRRAAELCRNMLAYSGKGHFVIEPLNLTHLIQDMAQMLKVSISKKVVLKHNLATDLSAIEADASQMRQVIMNLLVNASESIGDQNGNITIATGNLQCDAAYLATGALVENPAEGLYVYLDIEDSGCGMDASTLSKIFDPFFTTKFPGRGLGLAAVMGIVRGHKGIIKVRSAPGHGTTFRVLLPASDKAVPEEETEAAVQLYRGSGIVLLVDDEESLRALGKNLLEYLGFTALVAENGKDALNVFRERKGEISVVLMDLTMPQMDGEETFLEMKRLQPDVRVLLASGYGESEILNRFAGKGLAGFIQKPYQITVLSEKLQKILGNK
jgi:two-component system, cell cycle sensor histidine kinase and response regulator CckA